MCAIPELSDLRKGFISITDDDLMLEENTASLDIDVNSLTKIVLITPDVVYKARHSPRKIYCCKWQGGGGLTVRVVASSPIVN